MTGDISPDPKGVQGRMNASTDKVWQAYGYWAVAVGVTFFSIYPACNWFTSEHLQPFALYLKPELSIPFVPEFVWAYLSMYVLFMAPPFFFDVTRLNHLGKQLVLGTIFSGLAFLVIPAQLGFERVLPADPFYGALFSNLFAIDLPHNMAPSLHVVFSALILLLLLDTSRKTTVRIIWWMWLVLICLSTLLVHQHHILDVIAGLAVAVYCRYRVHKGEIHV